MYGSSDSISGLGGGGNSTIDIHVSVTINTTNSPTSTLNGGSGGSILNGGTTTAMIASSSPASLPMILNNSYTAPGTLADLKKQRSLQYLSRNHPLSFNGTIRYNNAHMYKQLCLYSQLSVPYQFYITILSLSVVA